MVYIHFPKKFLKGKEKERIELQCLGRTQKNSERVLGGTQNHHEGKGIREGEIEPENIFE